MPVICLVYPCPSCHRERKQCPGEPTLLILGSATEPEGGQSINDLPESAQKSAVRLPRFGEGQESFVDSARAALNNEAS